MKKLWKLGLAGILSIAVITGCAHKKAEEPVVPAAPPDETKLYEVIVKQVVTVSPSSKNAIPVIILANKENDEQILPIWVGASEGISINMALKKSVSERPGTHDLFADVLGQFQMKLVKVVITDLRESTYIATIFVECHGETKEIDARPSDSIAMALRCIAPIYVSEAVIQKGGWMKSPQQDEKPNAEKEEDSLL